MYKDRIKSYVKLEEILKSKVIVYITGDRQGFEAQINEDVIDLFINQLDKIGIVEKISLYLYTRGGNTAAAWNIVNLVRQYCDMLEVVVPHKAHSAGTLISIGANSIIMTKQATLGPIDPSINTSLNPQVPTGGGLSTRIPVSVEAVKGYFAFAKEELAIKDDIALSNIMIKLSEAVHPLVLGQVYRSRGQIKMLAEKLLVNQVKDPTKIAQIIDFLCSDSGSHDYTITRREAKNVLGLNVITPDVETYRIIKEIYDDISEDMGLRESFDIQEIAKTNLGEYNVKRCIIESIVGGCHYFSTQGKITIQQMQTNGLTVPNSSQINDERIFEGWKYESCDIK